MCPAVSTAEKKHQASSVLMNARISPDAHRALVRTAYKDRWIEHSHPHNSAR